MNVLIYHQAFDIYHCILRLLKILKEGKIASTDVEKLIVWDFYLLFPYEVTKNIKRSALEQNLKSIFKQHYNPYEEVIDHLKLFNKIKPYQLLALKNMASYGIIKVQDYEAGKVVLVSENIPKEIDDLLTQVTISEQNVVKYLVGPLNELPLAGKKGFKQKTGLLEFKYDREN